MWASKSSSSLRRWSNGLLNPPANCIERRLQFARVLGVDHTQHSFGLGEIEPAGQECPQGEFARLGQPCTALTQTRERRVQQRRRADRVQFGRGLAGVAAAGGPQIQMTRECTDRRRNVQVPEDPRGNSHIVAVFSRPLHENIGEGTTPYRDH